MIVSHKNKGKSPVYIQWIIILILTKAFSDFNANQWEMKSVTFWFCKSVEFVTQPRFNHFHFINYCRRFCDRSNYARGQGTR